MKYIVGNNNVVPSDVTGLVALNCNDQTFTSDDSGKTIFNDKKVIIGDDGASVQLSYDTITGATTIEAGNKGMYFVDATSNDIDITLQHDANYPVWFIRKDSTANNVYLIAGSGDINGTAQIALVGQYGQYTVVEDGTDFYALRVCNG